MRAFKKLSGKKKDSDDNTKASTKVANHKVQKSTPTGLGGQDNVVGVVTGEIPVQTVDLEQWNSKLPALDDLKLFKDANQSEKPDLFLVKLKACQRMFVWHDGVEPEDDPQWDVKEQKRKQLVDLVDYINQNPKNVFHEGNLSNIIEFASVNMFRGFIANPTPPHIQYDPEEDEPMLEPSWTHLQFVLEFFLRFVVSSDVDPKVARKHIDQPFIIKLLALFDSEDVRERDFLKTILHRIYGKFMQHRSFIRKSINSVFHHFIFNTEKHNGIAELLEILGSIINGFALPLKEEHKIFLRKSLIPLHKVKFVSMYHNQLSYCITQFCEKDYHLASEIILGILKFWPQTNSPKEVLYLQELEEVLELTQPQEFEAVIEPLFNRINRCIKSLHFQVAERVLFYWHNEYIVSYIAQYRQVILPLVFPSLMSNTNSHWNPTVYQLTVNVVKMFNEMDAQLFDMCATDYKKKVEILSSNKKQQRDQWKKLEEKAMLQAPIGWKPPVVRRASLLDLPAFDIDPAKLIAKTVEQPPPPSPLGAFSSKSRYGHM